MCEWHSLLDIGISERNPSETLVKCSDFIMTTIDFQGQCISRTLEKKTAFSGTIALTLQQQRLP